MNKAYKSHKTAGPTGNDFSSSQPARTASSDTFTGPVLVRRSLAEKPAPVMDRANILNLQRTYGNQAVLRMLNKQPGKPASTQVQRANLKQNYRGVKQEIDQEQQDAANTTAAPVVNLSLAIDVDTAGVTNRSKATRTGGVHAWLELTPVKDYKALEKEVPGLKAIGKDAPDELVGDLRALNLGSIGFYPEQTANFGKMAFIKQFLGVSPLGGDVAIPDLPSHRRKISATKTFALDKDKTELFFKWAKAKEAAPPNYSHTDYNCTNFAVEGVQAAGYNPGSLFTTLTSKKITAPQKVYKRLYERAALGDKSIRINTSIPGTRKHINSKNAKALASIAGGQDAMDNNLETNPLNHTDAFKDLNDILYQAGKTISDVVKENEDASDSELYLAKLKAIKEFYGLLNEREPWSFSEQFQNLTDEEKTLINSMYPEVIRFMKSGEYTFNKK